MSLPSRILHVRLSEPSPSLNTYQRWHWGKKGRYRDMVAMEVLAVKMKMGLPGNPPLPGGKTKVLIHRFSPGHLDRDNFIGGCKPIIDAIKVQGLLRDDNEEWLEAEYKQSKISRTSGVGWTNIEVGLCANIYRFLTKVRLGNVR